jgi:hypothetical protein
MKGKYMHPVNPIVEPTHLFSLAGKFFHTPTFCARRCNRLGRPRGPDSKGSSDSDLGYPTVDLVYPLPLILG